MRIHPTALLNPLLSVVFLVASLGASEGIALARTKAKPVKAATSGLPTEDYLRYLRKRLVTPAKGRHQPARWIESYEGKARAYTYDQALAVIAFTHAGDQRSARQILNALRNFQRPNGGWLFSYPEDDQNQISGAIAWVAMAGNAYAERFRSKEFDGMTRAALKHLAAQLVSIRVGKQKHQAVRFAPKDDRRTVWDESTVISLEHNLDAYAAFRGYRGKAQTQYRTIASTLRRFVESQWAGNHFRPGFRTDQNRPNLEELYLDTQTWGLLALGPVGAKGQDFSKGLEFACDGFISENQSSVGMFDYRPARGQAPDHFIWSEGTLGVIAATHVLQPGQTDPEIPGCEGRRVSELWKSIRTMTRPSGGVAYATKNRRGFSTRASVAGTAWAYFAAVRHNPFSPEPTTRSGSRLARRVGR